ASELPAVQIALLCGEDDSDRLSEIAAEWLAQRDLLYLLSAMCAPGDPYRFGDLGHALTANELYEAARLLSEAGVSEAVHADLTIIAAGRRLSNLETMVEIADRDDCMAIIAHMLGHDWLGHMAAGYMLRWVVSRHRAKLPDASLGRAASAI